MESLGLSDIGARTVESSSPSSSWIAAAALSWAASVPLSEAPTYRDLMLDHEAAGYQTLRKANMKRKEGQVHKDTAEDMMYIDSQECIADWHPNFKEVCWRLRTYGRCLEEMEELKRYSDLLMQKSSFYELVWRALRRRAVLEGGQ